MGIVRVSQLAGREGESFASPSEQRERIAAACERDGLRLVETIDELDVSGGAALERRTGLRRAVEAVEAGEAEVIVAAYFDRLVRSLRVQGEVVERVEAAGGRVLAIDFGEVTGKTAAQWLSGTMIGAVSEYYRRSSGERIAGAQARAVARGVVPWPNIPPGYRRGESGRLEPDPDTAPVVREAFNLRMEGATIAEVREYLRAHGIERSYHGTQTMLGSRTYLGEIHFGKLTNASAHEPLVSRDVWQAVQRTRVTRGRRPRSQRLLARLGILRCGTCGARMVVGHARGRWALYRCPPVGDCPRRVTISADIAEQVVSDAVRAALSGAEGVASAERSVRDAEAALERAQGDLDAALRAFAGLEDESAARKRLGELREVRDGAREHLDQLGGLRSAIVIRADEDWDRLTLDERRALIGAVVSRASVRPGRGPDRITVELVGEDSPSGPVEDSPDLGADMRG